MKKILEELKKGRTISQYPTGNVYGYGEYFRWDDTKVVVNCRSVWALRKKGVEIKIEVKDQVIKYK